MLQTNSNSLKPCQLQAYAGIQGNEVDLRYVETGNQRDLNNLQCYHHQLIYRRLKIITKETFYSVFDLLLFGLSLAAFSLGLSVSSRPKWQTSVFQQRKRRVCLFDNAWSITPTQDQALKTPRIVSKMLSVETCLGLSTTGFRPAPSLG